MSFTETVRKIVEASYPVGDIPSTPMLFLHGESDYNSKIRKLVTDFYDKSPSVLQTLRQKYPLKPWSQNNAPKKPKPNFHKQSCNGGMVELPASLNPYSETGSIVYLNEQYLTLKDIEDTIDAEWDWHRLSILSCLTSEFVHKHINKPWDWTSLSANHLDVWLAVKNPTRDWNWRLISSCWATPQDIKDYPDLPWDWNMLCGSPFMDVEFFESHMAKVNFGVLSYNKFLTTYYSCKKAFYRDLARRQWALEQCVSKVTGSDVAGLISLYYN
jgi:hypothetical protein